MKRICFFIVFSGFMLGSANAQYVWIDSHNVKHYSDQPPPASIPNSRILKMPRGQSPKMISETSPESTLPGVSKTAMPPDSLGKKPPMTTAEKNADFMKRKMEQAEKQKKAEEEKKRADAKARHCERSRDYQRSLQAGQRIARTGKSGQREYLSDEERARETQAVEDALKECN